MEDSHAVVRINTEKAYIPFTYFFLVVTSCKQCFIWFNLIYFRWMPYNKSLAELGYMTIS